MTSSLASRLGSLLWLSTLLFVWAVPHTIALRNVLLVGGFLWMLLLVRRRFAEILSHQAVRDTLIWLAAVSVWLVFQAVTFAAFPARTWGELKGQWLLAVISLLTGVFVGYCGKTNRGGFSENRLLSVIAGVMIAQIGLTTLDSLMHWWQFGQLPLEHARLTGTKSNSSFINNMLLAVLCADLLARLNGTKNLLPVGKFGFLSFSALCLFATYQLGARNGVIGVAFLTLSTMALYIFDNRKLLTTRAIVLAFAIAMSIVTGLVWMNLESDARWLAFNETVPIALDTEHHRAWLDTSSPLPLMPNGQSVDQSAYVRIAWMKEGAKLVADHPLGLGYDRDAFGAGLKLKFGAPGSGSSHSGWLDWTIGTGIPGTLLLLGFFGSLVIPGIRAYFAHRSPHGLVMVFLVSGFAGRMLVDGVNRDHSLQQFMFLVGVFLPLLQAGRNARRASTVVPAGRHGDRFNSAG